MNKSDSTPIYSALLYYLKQSNARFHTPAHNGKDMDGLLYSNAIMDITELDFDIKSGYSSIEKAVEQGEKLAEQIYGLSSFFLTDGGSCAVTIIMNMLTHYGNRILVGENCHKSIYANARLLGFIVDCVSNEKICSRLSEYDYAGVIITSPNYYGECVEYSEIASKAREKDIKVVIDISHGAHFPYGNNLPFLNMKGVDMAICSVHKTLPTYTSSAILLVDSNLSNLANYYKLAIHSTSPSYIQLASIDYARAYMLENGDRLYKELENRLNKFKAVINETIFCIRKNDDFTRVVIDCGAKCGYAVNAELSKRGIYAEMAIDNLVVLIVTPFNMEDLNKVAEALIDIEQNVLLDNYVDNYISLDYTNLKMTNDNIPIRQRIKFVRIENAKDYVLASEIGIYPPSTVMYKSGDIIDKKMQDFLIENKKHIFGLVKELVPVLE